jgi:hypothetical protein
MPARSSSTSERSVAEAPPSHHRSRPRRSARERQRARARDARLALELVIRSPRRTLEVAGFILGLASWLLATVGILGSTLGLGIFPAEPPHEQPLGPVDQEIAPPER